ncbi:hypothetical protein D8M04_19805 [Oceanobacillus piezotolerans]|uniref:Uncharacterized protein n=1 Tax=Oceanobacillus piezotolerans TaxID=2448030 RepID=A0A498D0Z3_9BACI|nr:hypothetical protein D8M04_19805 [Oceanobacillus piezotolerans]
MLKGKSIYKEDNPFFRDLDDRFPFEKGIKHYQIVFIFLLSIIRFSLHYNPVNPLLLKRVYLLLLHYFL